MQKLWILVILIWATGSVYVIAAMDPEEIKEIKKAAPLHLQGEVIADTLIRETDFPGQERIMSIRISEIHKGAQLAEPDNTIEVSYTYIPEWVEAEGGARMDIAVSDRLEIWLKEENGVWTPAASGDTVMHLSKGEERPEHMPEPIRQAAVNFFTEMELPLIIGLLLGATLAMAAFLSAKFRPFHK